MHKLNQTNDVNVTCTNNTCANDKCADNKCMNNTCANYTCAKDLCANVCERVRKKLARLIHACMICARIIHARLLREQKIHERKTLFYPTVLTWISRSIVRLVHYPLHI